VSQDDSTVAVSPAGSAPDERPQRRREYSGAAQTLGLAALILVTVGAGIWFLEFRDDTGGAAPGGGFGIVALPANLNPTGKSAAAQQGRAAPDFRLEQPGGGALRLTDLRGKFVLLNAWASWCGPCRGEAPDLQALSEKHPDSLVVLGLNQQEDEAQVRQFVQDFALTYPVVMDRTGEVSDVYRAQELPVSYLLSPDGVVLKVFMGRLTPEQIRDIEREYLGS
jgi:thiol-disulfide isomerase/thioredoxin